MPKYICMDIVNYLKLIFTMFKLKIEIYTE